jgi:hypothetical protein
MECRLLINGLPEEKAVDTLDFLQDSEPYEEAENSYASSLLSTWIMPSSSLLSLPLYETVLCSQHRDQALSQ